jgi:hypothetical protein
MRKLTKAAVALTGVAALTSAATLPGAASVEDRSITRKYVLHEIDYRQLGKNRAVGTDSVQRRGGGGGAVVGYSSYFGRFSPERGAFVVRAALALDGGTITVRAAFEGDNSARGPILGGTGKFAGIEGIARAHSPKNDDTKTLVALRYHR